MKHLPNLKRLEKIELFSFSQVHTHSILNYLGDIEKTNDNLPSWSVVLLGGYDLNVKENVDYLKELFLLVQSYDLKPIIKKESSIYEFISKRHHDEYDVLFAPSIRGDDKNLLMQYSLCVIYTPEREHFGIVPIEAMALGTPVIAVNSGGPMESIIDGYTGFLVPSLAQDFTKKMNLIFDTPSDDYRIMSECAMKHVRTSFSFSQFSLSLEKYCNETISTSRITSVK